MNSLGKYLLGYVFLHILFISLLQAFFCTDLKFFELGFILVVFLLALFNPHKIRLERVDILIVFLLAFLNVYYTFIEMRGLVYFKMTYVLFLSILLSKLILPNVTLKNYFSKLNSIYKFILIALIIEFFILAVFGEEFISYLFMCNGDQTGIRGYIPLNNMAKNILPFHVQGLNSIMLGSQTASQFAVIIFVWFLYLFKINNETLYKSLALLSICMLFLSPSFTAILLLGFALLMIYFIDLKDTFRDRIENFYMIYVILIIGTVVSIVFLQLLNFKYDGIEAIYNKYIYLQLFGFSYFDLQEILFGVTQQRELELFSVGEISFITQLIDYGIIGFGVFYFSILYYIFRALQIKNVIAVRPTLIVLSIFILGNLHYQVMFSIGVMELFALHLAYIIYVGSNSIKSK